MKNILVVCTGNICRSPMAEAVLKSRLTSQHRVESAGISAVVGYPPTSEMSCTANTRGLDLTSHRARQLTDQMATEFDLLLVMDRSHKRWVGSHIPQARGKTFGLGHWRNCEIPDPYGASLDFYEQTCQLIESCSEDWLERL